MTVAEVLSYLSMQRLRALCQERDLDAPRRRDQIVTRLARSYRGDTASVLDNLHSSRRVGFMSPRPCDD